MSKYVVVIVVAAMLVAAEPAAEQKPQTVINIPPSVSPAPVTPPTMPDWSVILAIVTGAIGTLWSAYQEIRHQFGKPPAPWPVPFVPPPTASPAGMTPMPVTPMEALSLQQWRKQQGENK